MNQNVRSIILVAMVGACLLGCSNGSGDSSSTSSGSMDYIEEKQSYEEAKMSVEDHEAMDPVSFIETDGTYRSNLIGEWVMEGTVSSKATAATYKDIEINFKFYSKTKTLIGDETHVLYEFLKPGSSIPFKIKSNGYRGTSSIGWSVSGANAVR